jgi:hypothetical protein
MLKLACVFVPSVASKRKSESDKVGDKRKRKAIDLGTKITFIKQYERGKTY